MKLSVDLVSDLDGTWLPAHSKVKALRELEGFLASEPQIVLTFATGRSLLSALAALTGVARALPRHFVTDVGTAIHHRNGTDEWVEDAVYARWVEERWDQEAVEGATLRSLPRGVRPQAAVLGRRRLALETQEGTNLFRAAKGLARKLEKSGLSADVLPSSGRCLDVLPKGVDKGAAVEYLRKRGHGRRPLVVCGDSENDLGMLRIADVAVIMADSTLGPELLGDSRARVIRTRSPGPGGILEVLLGLAQPGSQGCLTGAGG